MIIVRHAIAEERSHFARPGKVDADRPLTFDGIKKMQKVSIGLLKLFPDVKTILSSPYKRARETAEIISEYADSSEISFHVSLTPEGDPTKFLKECFGLNDSKTKSVNEKANLNLARDIVIVGHEPSLSRLIRLCIFGLKAPSKGFELKKGGVCVLQFEKELGFGSAELEYFLKPSLLRKLSKT